MLTGGPGRLERGFELMERGLAPADADLGRRAHGAARRSWPRPIDVDPRLFECCIALGRESFDTRSNADEVARWLERRRFASIRLVTNDLHMPRARYEVAQADRRATSRIVADAVPTEPELRADLRRI